MAFCSSDLHPLDGSIVMRQILCTLGSLNLAGWNYNQGQKQLLTWSIGALSFSLDLLGNRQTSTLWLLTDSVTLSKSAFCSSFIAATSMQMLVGVRVLWLSLTRNAGISIHVIMACGVGTGAVANHSCGAPTLQTDQVVA